MISLLLIGEIRRYSWWHNGHHLGSDLGILLWLEPQRNFRLWANTKTKDLTVFWSTEILFLLPLHQPRRQEGKQLSSIKILTKILLIRSHILGIYESLNHCLTLKTLEVLMNLALRQVSQNRVCCASSGPHAHVGTGFPSVRCRRWHSLPLKGQELPLIKPERRKT